MDIKEFQEIIYDKQTQILFVYVNEKTADIDDEDFKNAQYEIVNEVLKNKPFAILINVQKLLFSISPELQEWDAVEIAPKIFETGVKKIAYIMPFGLIEKLSVEQILEEVEERKILQRKDFGIEFFENEKEAIEWCVLVNL